MKMFAAVLLLSLLAVSAFASGDGDKDAMEDDIMMAKDTMEADDSMGSMELIPPFLDFTDLETAAMKADSMPTVLFFYATWCPSCKSAKKELQADPGKLDDINLIIVDYDDSDDLQKKYGVTYQHTFVLIDSAGEAIEVWNGGGVDDIVMNAMEM